MPLLIVRKTAQVFSRARDVVSVFLLLYTHSHQSQGYLPCVFMRLALVCFYCLSVFVYVFYFIATMSFVGYFLSVLFCPFSMLISDSRFDLVWFRLSCDHGWIRSGSVNVRKQQQLHADWAKTGYQDNILLVVSSTGKVCFPCPRSRLRSWSQGADSAVPSCTSPRCFYTVRLNLVYSKAASVVGGVGCVHIFM